MFKKNDIKSLRKRINDLNFLKIQLYKERRYKHVNKKIRDLEKQLRMLKR